MPAPVEQPTFAAYSPPLEILLRHGVSPSQLKQVEVTGDHVAYCYEHGDNYFYFSEQEPSEIAPDGWLVATPSIHGK